jgi:hypothetical protein
MASIPDVDLERIKRYCAKESPAALADKLRIIYKTRGNSVTILETRPPWDGRGTEWTEQGYAQLRYSPDSTKWSLYWSDRNSRWHPYDLIEPGSLASLLAEIDEDPTCIFKG